MAKFLGDAGQGGMSLSPLERIEDLLAQPIVTDTDPDLRDSTRTHALKVFCLDLIAAGEFDAAAECLGVMKENLDSTVFWSFLKNFAESLHGTALNRCSRGSDNLAQLQFLLVFVRLQFPDLYESTPQWDMTYFARKFDKILKGSTAADAFAFLDAIEAHLELEHLQMISRFVGNRVQSLVKGLGKKKQSGQASFELLEELERLALAKTYISSDVKSRIHSVLGRRSAASTHRSVVKRRGRPSRQLDTASASPFEAHNSVSFRALVKRAESILRRDPHSVEGLTLAFRASVLAGNLEIARRIDTGLGHNPDPATVNTRIAMISLLEESVRSGGGAERGPRRRRSSRLMGDGTAGMSPVGSAGAVCRGGAREVRWKGAPTSGRVVKPDIK